ncbi:hypothetical protein [Sphingobacterium sp. LRF_L2]|uniref:hypothetical protein n=1 Tax=Sphingobacterium sp. LRF_L2 TaxID=3369421 RepID=UPI003F605D0D
MFICLSVSFSGVAQQYQLDSVVHRINGTQFIASQKYDAKTKKAELTRYKQIETHGAIQNIERSQVTYDDKGNEIYYVFSIWDSINNTWNEEEKTEKEYNADNRLVRTSIHSKQSNSWVKVSENIRLYTPDSIAETDYEVRNDKFTPVHKNISINNAFGKVKIHKIFHWNDETQNWLQQTRTMNLYQNDTVLIGFETLQWKENQWQKQEKVDYVLDKNGNRTDSYTLYHPHNNNWIAILKFEEEVHDPQNKRISRTYTSSKTNRQWTLRSQTETYFNNSGKKQDVLFSELDTSTHQLKLQLEQMHLYDRAGRLTLFQDFDYANERITGTQNTVKFGKEGNVIQEDMYEWDMEHNTWIEKMTTKIEYDQNIELDTTLEAHKNSDLFGLNEHNYSTNKYAPKHVKIYKYQGGEQVIQEEFDYFYSLCR